MSLNHWLSGIQPIIAFRNRENTVWLLYPDEHNKIGELHFIQKRGKNRKKEKQKTEKRKNMGELKVGEIIKELRGSKGISQEMLADVCGVSMQAVSKWENGQSCPDIAFLPTLAEYFQVTADYLLTGKGADCGSTLEKEEAERIKDSLRDGTERDVLYVIQYRNGEILDKKKWEKERKEGKQDAVKIFFGEEFGELAGGLQVEVWGNAEIESRSVAVDVKAGGNVNCGTVEGDVNAEAGVSCGTVGGNVSAGSEVNCGTVEGDVSAEAGVNCGTVEGNVSAGSEVNCDTVEGDVKAGSNVTCGDVEGSVKAGCSVTCGNICGDAKAGMNIMCGQVQDPVN